MGIFHGKRYSDNLKEALEKKNHILK